MFSSRPLARLALVAAAGLLAAAAPALAALTAELRDSAGMFKPDTLKQADAVVRAIKHDYGQDLLIETYAGIPADKKAEYEKAKGDPEKRKHFFAEWGRARFKAAEVNGVYILITKDPGYLQIEVGNITAERTFTMKNRDHLEALMLKEFKAKEYDKGLLDGVNYVREAMGENLKGTKAARPAPAAPPPTDYPAPTETARPSLFAHGGWLGLLCIGLAVIAGIWVIFALVRGLFGARRGYGGPGGYGGPAYGGPAYGGGYGYGGGGGGGFFSNMLGGLFGGAAGSWLYDRFFHGGSAAGGYGGGYGGTTPTATPAPEPPPQQDTDATGVGGDFGGDTGADAGGGDFGGDAGGDTGGGDFGGDAGGDTGGGDFGGDTGGGDFGGGGDDGGGGSF